MQRDSTPDAWLSIRQFRKNLQPSKGTPRSNHAQLYGSPFSNISKCLSAEKRDTPLQNSCLSSNPDSGSDKENDPYMINQTTFHSIYKAGSAQDEVLVTSGPNSRETQQFCNPLNKEDEISKPFSQVTLDFSPFNTSENIMMDQSITNNNPGSSLIKKRRHFDDYLQTGESRESQTERNYRLFDRKTPAKVLEQSPQLNLPLKVRNQVLKMRLDEFPRHTKEFQNLYNKIEMEIEQKYKLKLQEKDEEIRSLKMNLLRKTQIEHDKRDLLSTRKRIEEYEELINGMRMEYEARIISSEKYYKKKAVEYLNEKEKILEELENLREEIKQLRQRGSLELLEGSSKEEKISGQKGEMQTSTLKKKRGKGVQRLLDKINRYMEENSIESEVTVTNRKDLYKKIYKAETLKRPQEIVSTEAREEETDWKLWTIKDIWSRNEKALPALDNNNFELEAMLRSLEAGNTETFTHSSDPEFFNYSVSKMDHKNFQQKIH